ncbi:LLM class flavin-dependent oxidoreductase, partial [Burkholderia cenocepacia]
MTPSASTRADVPHRVFSAGRLSNGLTLPLLRSGHIVADSNEHHRTAAPPQSHVHREIRSRHVP